MIGNDTPKQLNDLGDQYFEGLGKEKNIELAFTYYKKAADLNNPIGYYNVGRYFIEKEQFKQAYEYLNKAKDLGYTVASMKLSDMYLNGLGFRKNKKKAFKYMNEAVLANDSEAMHRLGLFYEQGIGCRRNELDAKKYYQLSADNKVSEGMYLLGCLYLEAKSFKKDYENGFFWLDKASEFSNVHAIKKLISLYHNSHPHLKKKSQLYLKEMEFYYLELLAKLKDIEALKEVAMTYYLGSTVTKQNFEKAKTYFTILYKLDETVGYRGLGFLYLYAKAFEQDYNKAKDLLEVAATRNDALAMNALGEIYRLGYGVEINYNRAKDYYFEAAKAQETNALINIGLLNYRNQITGAKPALAFQYMQQAKAKGNNTANYWLGIFYDKGVGVPKDFKKAEEAFKQAIESNNEGAKYKYAQMLYDHVTNASLSNKKKNVIYLQIRDLLFEYINSPVTSEINTTYAMYMLGTLYSFENFDLKSKKIARYYFELAAENKFTKAMIQMYKILKDQEALIAYNYLLEAVKRPADGESLYELANLYLIGTDYVKKDLQKAKELFGKAAGMKYLPAKEKLRTL
ncbi:MAG: sel1 repeat family protein [Tenericutes bacterium]|nr:sel1 repeat family protein [Mycoplasmatota bacterium]